MPHYQPIMKAKPGEFVAWQNASATVRSMTDPLFELAWNPKSNYENYLRTTVDKIVASHSTGTVVTIDGGHLDQLAASAPGGRRLIPWLKDELAAAGLVLRPVARPDDVAGITADIRAAAVAGVAVRIGTAGTPPVASYVSNELPALVARLALGSGDVHVTLDFQEISSDAAVGLYKVAADQTLDWFSRQSRYASIHVASAAFPASISGLPLATPNLLDRYDAAFYSSLNRPVGLDVGFADYVVNSPGPVSPDARAPLPNLRYTTGSQWLVWREAKRQPGNSGFYVVCDGVVASGYFLGRALSWGDAYIDDKAMRIGGAGTAKEWRSAGTSHHLQVVANRLATLGEP